MSETGDTTVTVSSTKDDPLLKELNAIPEKRALFIAKVFTTVSIQLLVTFVIGIGVYHSSTFQNMSSQQLNNALIATLVISIVSIVLCFIAVECYKAIACALIPFSTFTIAQSFVFGVAIYVYGADIIMQASAIAFITTAGCVGFIMYSKKNLHSWHGVAYFMLFGLTVTGIVLAIFPPSTTVEIIYCIFGILVFIIYLLIDTSDLIHHYEEHEWLIASLNIYLDILNLIMYIARLLKTLKGNDR